MRRIYLHKICNEVLSVFKRLTLSIADKIVCFFIPVAILSYMIYKLHVLPTWTLIIMIILFVLSIPYIAFVEDMSGEDILSLGQYYKDDDEDDDIDFENDDDNKKDE
ncbi:MAG: hypothetical protein IJS47_02545 [Clostridia bacterium]|nr:hypothetical protein [Clostridia bacterium]